MPYLKTCLFFLLLMIPVHTQAEALYTSRPAPKTINSTLSEAEKNRVLEKYTSLIKPETQPSPSTSQAPETNDAPEKALQQTVPANPIGMMLKQVTQQNAQGTPLKTMTINTPQKTKGE